MSFSKICTIVLLGSMLMFTSCKKYLDKKPNNALNTPSTLKDLQAILDYSTNMNLLATPSLNEFSADSYFFPPDIITLYSSEQQQMYSWQPIEYMYSNDWNKAYLPIYNANICLEYLEKIPKTNQNSLEWDNVKGASLFFRAYFFSQLLWSFAKAYDENTANTDLGIVLRLTSDFNVASVRASVKESYDQVISDATQAAEYLPTTSEHPLRPGKIAAYGLLARIYLSMRQYDNAFKYSDSCLSNKSDLLNYDNKLEVNVTSNVPFMAYNKEAIFYTTMNGEYTLFSRSLGALIDTVLYSSYEANDKRKSAYFRTGIIPGYFGFKGNYTGSAALFFSGIATDEMYLTRAECYARNGNRDAALSDLNMLLVNRYDSSFMPIITPDASAALIRILLERRKELLFRGLRWMDIKRLNKEGNNITIKRFVGLDEYTLMPNANYYALPLPTDIINIAKLPQNPQ